MSERNKRAERAIWRQYKGRIIGLLSAFIFALLWVVFNFETALLVFIIAAVGYIVGAYFDGEVDLRAWLRFFMK
ncbi:DUF2273 domain-containing protein [Aerococcus sp. NPDC058936]|uniref:DUF2273 domain-containing protein n=1 Tax=Aerococcus sp. NPDC058936 TaxID=3346674 RepID=UPI00366A852D